jgi:hypothetical protein
MQNAGAYILTLILAGCSLIPGGQAPASTSLIVEPGITKSTEPTKPIQVDLPDYGSAPEFTNQVWLNTDAPLHLADLRGKVVLLDMWTFG